MKWNYFIINNKVKQAQPAALADAVLRQADAQFAHGVGAEAGINVSLLGVFFKAFDGLFNACFRPCKLVGYLFKTGIE